MRKREKNIGEFYEIAKIKDLVYNMIEKSAILNANMIKKSAKILRSVVGFGA